METDHKKPEVYINELPEEVRLELGNAVRQMREGKQILNQHLIGNNPYGAVVEAQTILDVLGSYTRGGNIGPMCDRLQCNEAFLIGIFETIGISKEELKESGYLNI